MAWKKRLLFILSCLAILNLGAVNRDSLPEGMHNDTLMSFTAEAVQISAGAAPVPHIHKVGHGILESFRHRPVADIMNTVPGVLMQHGALNTNRLTIRGMGNRSPFSTSRINVFVGDIPVTDGSGETTLEDLDLSFYKNVSIIKGPYSSSYGAGLGGAVLIDWPETEQANTLSVGLSPGSFGYRQFSTGFTYAANDQVFRLSQQNILSEGYRDNNQYAKGLYNLMYQVKQERATIRFIMMHTNLAAQIPGALNISDYKNTPHLAAPNWAAAKGYENYRRTRGGVNWTQAAGKKLIISTSAFGHLFNSFEFRPFNAQELESKAVGMRSSISGIEFPGDMTLRAGIELFNESYRVSTYESLGTQTGDELSGIVEDRARMSIFADWEKEINKIKVSGGINVQEISYSRMNSRELNISKSRFGTSFNPKANIEYAYAANQRLFLSAARGISQPTLEETLLPDGRINQDLDLETGWSFEAGWHAHWLNPSLKIRAQMYHTRARNLIISRRTAEDSFISLNAGSAIMQGLELFMQKQVSINAAARHESSVSLQIADHFFGEFQDNGMDHSGKTIPGSPAANIFWTNRFVSGEWTFQLELTHVGAYPIDDSNTVYNDAYTTGNFTVSRSLISNALGEGVLRLAVHNFWNEKYAAMTTINASSFGNALPRYYYPANPAHIFVTFNWKFKSWL